METTQIVKALATVTDPKTGQNLITANLVRDLKVAGNNVSFTLELAAVDAAVKQDLNFACQTAILDIYPQAQVHVHLLNPQVAAPNQANSSANPLPQVRNIIAVASGKGGVGKSTVAVNLALGLQALGASVGLLDADVYGPSAPTMLGLQGKKPEVEQLYGKPKIKPIFAYGLPVMSIGFIIEPEQAVVMRGPRLAGIIRQFFEETLWPPLDYLVVDLPPGTGDVQLTLVQVAKVTGVVMVTTPQEVALVDAVKALNMFRLDAIDVPILGVVENMAWFTPEELPNNKYYLFGKGGGEKLARQANSMLLGQIPIVQSIREGGDSGQPAVLQKENTPVHQAWMQVARNVSNQIALLKESQSSSI